MGSSNLNIFGVQKDSRNVVLTVSKVSEVLLIPFRERELVSLSLSLGFTQITCDTKHQCYQVVAEWKETFVVIHVCSISLFSVSGVFGSKAVSPLVSRSAFPEPHRQDTDFVFVLRSWTTSASCPSKRL